jgi:hypothetical protein
MLSMALYCTTGSIDANILTHLRRRRPAAAAAAAAATAATAAAKPPPKRQPCTALQLRLTNLFRHRRWLELLNDVHNNWSDSILVLDVTAFRLLRTRTSSSPHAAIEEMTCLQQKRSFTSVNT